MFVDKRHVTAQQQSVTRATMDGFIYFLFLENEHKTTRAKKSTILPKKLFFLSRIKNVPKQSDKNPTIYQNRPKKLEKHSLTPVDIADPLVRYRSVTIIQINSIEMTLQLGIIAYNAWFLSTNKVQVPC